MMTHAEKRRIRLAWRVAALTGFLDVLRALRERFAWFPMPEFAFAVWLAGLAGGIAVMLLVTRWIPGRLRLPAAAFAGLMILNALGHTVGTVRGRTVASVPFARPMPGAAPRRRPPSPN